MGLPQLQHPQTLYRVTTWRSPESLGNFLTPPFSPHTTASDDEFENLRIKGPNAVQLVKTTPVKPAALPAIPDPIKDVIYDMLNALAAYHAPEEGTDDFGPPPGNYTTLLGITPLPRGLESPPGEFWGAVRRRRKMGDTGKWIAMENEEVGCPP